MEDLMKLGYFLLTKPVCNCVKDAADMIPASMLGSLTAVIALDGPLAPFDSPRADHARVLGAVRARVNISAGITAKE